MTNTGNVPGAEVIQLYIAADAKTSSIGRARKELKGFSKVFLEPGETREVLITLDKFATAFWDEILHKWVSEKGIYTVLVGKSSAMIMLEGVFEVTKTVCWKEL